MNKNLIRTKSTISSFKICYALCLLMVFIFGLYKNIINLIINGLSSSMVLSKLLFIIIGVAFGLIADYTENKKINFGLNSIIGIMIAMIIPFNTNFIVYLLGISLIILIDLFDKNKNLNKICIIKIFIILLLILFKDYSYLNPLELKNEYAYSLGDLFLGNQVGGIFSSSVLLILISFLILSFNKIYKTKITIITICSYIVILSLLLLTKNYMDVFKIMQNSSNIFTFVFITPFTLYSPYKNKQVLIYSISIGCLSALLSFYFLEQEGAIIATLFINILMILINKFHKTTNISKTI